MAKTEVVYQSRRFYLERREVAARDGSMRKHEYMVHPGAAVILPILDDGRIVLLWNYRSAIDRELLELPAGTIDPPEQPAECAARELEEETGYRAAELRPLPPFFTTPGICTERMHAFVALGLAAGTAHPGPGERIRPELMEYSVALRAIEQGDIMDGKTIATLLYYDRFLSGGVAPASSR